MNNSNGPRSGDTDSSSERALQQLFAHAAPREAPPAADEAEIREAVYREWDAITGRRLWLRRTGAFAAASVMAVGVAMLLTIDGQSPGPVVAQIERVQGAIRVDGDPAQIGDDLPAGAVVSTGSGQIAMRLMDGGSLRLAPQTELTLVADDRVELIAGTLYFDSEGRVATRALSVLTEIGTVSDIGTQFIARFDRDELEVGVRDGRVAIARDDERTSAGSGERLVVAGNAREVRRETIPTFGEDWAWAESLAPPFDIDGRNVIEFLNWVAEQTGRRLQFSDSATELIARETEMSGSIDLAPLPKLTAVLAITDLDYVIDGETILISTK